MKIAIAGTGYLDSHLIPGFSFGVWGWFQENVLKAL
jgi:hypothetical protein